MEELFGRYFLSLFLIILFAIRLSTQRTARDIQLRYFWLTVISCLLLTMEDFGEIIASEDPELRLCRTVLSIAGYTLRSTATLGLALVVVRPEKRIQWRLCIPCLINFLICSTALFSDIVFGFDEEYRFYRGPLGFIPFIVPLGYLIVILWVTLRRFADVRQKTDRLILVICAVMGILAAALDATFGGVHLHDAILISSVFFYIFLRSYDVRRDSLTLLLNRQSLYDDCASPENSIRAAASLDLNGLKDINKSRGYHAADDVLKQIGKCLLDRGNQQIRPYRIGGDEFVILFQEMEEAEIRNTLEEIQEEISEMGYQVSCGYAMRNENENMDSLIRRADIRMFERKAQFYQSLQRDRRWHGSATNSEYTDGLAQSIADLPQPCAIFRYADHVVEPLAVSDGLCKLLGFPDQQQAVHTLDEGVFRSVLTDDRERLSGAVLRFAEGSEDLNVVYRTRAGISDGYRVIHVRGVLLHTGTEDQIGFLWFMDEGVYIPGEEEAGTELNQSLNKALHDESVLHAAQYDQLTGLPNLAWYFTLYETAKEKILSEGEQAALLYIDLNGLETFNRRNGLAEGDRLLKCFAEILTGIFGKDRCCHMVAGRFAAVTRESAAERQIEQIFREAAEMNGGKNLPVRIGIYSTEMEDVAFSSAYDRAKMACDNIRNTDKSAAHRFSRKLHEEAKKHQYLVDNLDRAIAENWIQVYYQPIVRAISGEICDEEALARWQDPVQGFLSPDDFIPHLENAGLIYRMDLYVLDQVLQKISEEKAAGGNPVPHSINLSRADFEACDIVEEIRKRVDAAGIGHDRISIEITESIIGTDLQFMKEQIARFRALGFPVWMDDFGSGYSSLAVLENIQFDLIKFDMSFMRKFDEDGNGKVVLTELLRMACALGVDTICEGVETEAHVHFLQEAGCSKLQGYLYGRPVPREQISERSHGAVPAAFENAAASAYYEAIGRLNLFDLDVLTSTEENSFQHSFNTLPMAIVEVRDDLVRYVRNTPSYRQFVRRFFGEERAALRKDFLKYTTPFMVHIVKTCRGQGSRTFFDEKMPDGAVIHSFARKIGFNPVNGDQAIAIAVLSISDSTGNGTEE